MESQRLVHVGKVSGRELLFVGARKKTRKAPDHSASNSRSGCPHNLNVATDLDN